MDALFDKIKVSKKEFFFQYQSHPDYPSALAFSDTLNFLNIENEAYEVDKESWCELPNKFIGIYKGSFALIEKLKKGYLISINKTEKINEKELYAYTEDFVMLLNQEEQSQKSDYNYRWNRIIVVLFSLMCLVYQFNTKLFFYNFLSFIGVFLSFEIFQKKFGIESFVINTFCANSNENNKKIKDNCSQIINSDHINIFGLKLSDFSLIYFLSVFLFGLLISESLFFIKIISFTTIVVVFYSFYVQIIVEKIFCRVCLFINLILISQIILVYDFEYVNFSWKAFFVLMFLFSCIIYTVIYVNDILTQNEKLIFLNVKNNKFKRRYDIFKNELKQKNVYLLYKPTVFWIGNKNAKINISLITNPFCNYCKDAHAILERILIKYPDISAQIRFNYYEDENLESLITIFKNVYDVKGAESFLNVIDHWYKINDISKFKNIYKDYMNKTDLSEIVALAMDNKYHDYTFTPVFFINNFQFPDKYDRDDIFYFIDEMLEDNEIIKIK